MLELYQCVLETRASERQARVEHAASKGLDDELRALAVVGLRVAEGRRMRAEAEVARALSGLARQAMRTCRADAGRKDDVTQEICFRVLKSSSLERRHEGGPGMAWSWTNTVVRNAVASACRAEKQRPRPLDPVDLEREGGASPFSQGQVVEHLRLLLDCATEGALMVVSGEVEVPEDLDARWTEAQVPRKLEGLRLAIEVFRRTHFEGEDYVELAHELGVSRAVARRARSRGRHAIRLGAAMVLHHRCCDSHTRLHLEEFAIHLGRPAGGAS